MNLLEFFEKHNCNEEERKLLYDYLQVIRLIPHLEMIKMLNQKMYYELRQLFKKY